MASKERKYIEARRQSFRSPIALCEAAEQLAENDADEAYYLYSEAISWASWNDMAVQDYVASTSGIHQVSRDDAPRFVGCVRQALKAMSDHLKRGLELGLSGLEQRVVDTLWGWVPHDYPDSYVACAREVSEAIVRLLPPEEIPRTDEGYKVYLRLVIAEVKRLATKHNVEFDTTNWDLPYGYFCDWLKQEYGLLPIDMQYDFDEFNGEEQ